MHDLAIVEYRDYALAGDTAYHADELKAWGATWHQSERAWILHNSSEVCSDYQAIFELGIELMPIQEMPTEKMMITQLFTRRFL